MKKQGKNFKGKPTGLLAGNRPKYSPNKGVLPKLGNNMKTIEERFPYKHIVEINSRDYLKIKHWVGAKYAEEDLSDERFTQMLNIAEGLKDDNGDIKLYLENAVIFIKDAEVVNEYSINYYPYELNENNEIVFPQLAFDPNNGSLITLYKNKLNISRRSYENGIKNMAPRKVDPENDPKVHFLRYMDKDKNLLDKLPNGQEFFDKLPEEKKEDIKTVFLALKGLCAIEVIVFTNLYLLAQDKTLLFTDITQRTEPKGHTPIHKAKKPGMLYYRYVMNIPDDYKPRKFENINYVEPEWDRAGHKRPLWVNVANAEKLAIKNGGNVLWHTKKDNKVQIQIQIKPQKVYRRCVEIDPTKAVYKTKNYK